MLLGLFLFKERFELFCVLFLNKKYVRVFMVFPAQNICMNKVLYARAFLLYACVKTPFYILCVKKIKIKLRSFKSLEHINVKGNEPYRGFGYLKSYK